ncbi:MAG TPA: nuclear transport factor 2 family protein [Acidimicrobiia bacterium]|nr:nuclear transport factor 2 family protein [Acidimicrobiia bacterium]
MSDADDVRAANAGFYTAFEARDLDAMAEVWERSDRVSVTRPGWPTLRGWARVAGSWQAIFSATPFIQFVLTDEEVLVDGEVAMVTLDENILQSGGATAEGEEGELAGARVATTNVFVRRGSEWRMVNHHGSPVYRDVP